MQVIEIFLWLRDKICTNFNKIFQILIDNNRYYIIKGWVDESYNKVLYNDVPIIDREITYDEYFNINKSLQREKKLERLLKDENN